MPLMAVFLGLSMMVFLPLVFTRIDGCNETSIDIKFEESRGAERVWSTGAPIEVSISICTRSNFSIFTEIGVILSKTNSATTIGYAFMASSSDLTCFNSTYSQLTCFLLTSTSGDKEEYFFNITIHHARSEYNNSVIQVVMNGWPMHISLPITVKDCTPFDAPDSLYITGVATNYSYGDIANGKCIKDAPFLNGNYSSDNVSLICGRYGQWETPAYSCEQGCSSNTSETIVANEMEFAAESSTGSVKYKRGTTVSLKCKSGLVYLREGRFATSIPAFCDESSEWRHPKAHCWTGAVVDFTKDSMTLISGMPVVFVCQPKSSSGKVQVNIEDLLTMEKEWKNMTASSQLHGVTAECDEIDSEGDIILKRKQKLNLLFAPEMTGENSLFELTTGSHDAAVIKFQANPTIQASDVKVFKRGASVSNYYLLASGVKHEVVIDFMKVSDSDVGEYQLVMKYDGRTFVHNFTVSVTESPSSLSVPQAVGITSGVAIVIMLSLAVTLFVLQRKYRKIDRRKASDSNNYEEIGRIKTTMHGQNSEHPERPSATTAFSETDKNQFSQNEQGYEVPIASSENIQPASATIRPLETVYEYNN